MLTGIGRVLVIYIFCTPRLAEALNHQVPPAVRLGPRQTSQYYPVFNLTLQFHRNSTEARVRDSRPPYTLAP